MNALYSQVNKFCWLLLITILFFLKKAAMFSVCLVLCFSLTVQSLISFSLLVWILIGRLFVSWNGLISFPKLSIHPHSYIYASVGLLCQVKRMCYWNDHCISIIFFSMQSGSSICILKSPKLSQSTLELPIHLLGNILLSSA